MMSGKTGQPGNKAETNWKEVRKDLLDRYGIILVLIAMSIVMAIMSPAFLKQNNIINIFKQVAVIGVLAYGATLVMITGGIDLAAGSVVALVGVIVASFAGPGSNLFIAILIGLFVGALTGAISGYTIATTNIPPFIATLGMMTVARGAALLFTDGRPISDLADAFLYLGAGNIGFMPVPVLIFLLMGLLTHIILRKTSFGKAIYAVGGNEQAAVVCGLNVKRIKIMVYGYAGLMSAVGGIILTSRISSGNPTAGLSFELDAIASAVIGGTSQTGGVGFISGTIIGALIIGVLNNGLTLIGVSPYWQQIIKGLIIVAAVIFDARKHKK